MNMSDFQVKVKLWVERVMGEDVARNKGERCRRFMEEAAELVQAAGMTQIEALQMVRYAYARPIGVMEQEVGGVCTTLSALCSAYYLNLDHCATAELERIHLHENDIRDKHNAKARLGLATQMGTRCAHGNITDDCQHPHTDVK